MWDASQDRKENNWKKKRKERDKSIRKNTETESVQYKLQRINKPVFNEEPINDNEETSAVLVLILTFFLA